MIERIRPWRRLAEALQAVLILGIPFLRINGESALRFDVPSLKLYFFGSVLWMDEFFIVLTAIIFLTFLIILTTLLFGRIWCGWMCPQSVLVDFTDFSGIFKNNRPVGKALTWAASLIAGAVVGADLLWYFVSPYEFFDGLTGSGLGPVIGGSWLVMSIIVFLDLAFLGRKFCSTVCPYAKLQSTIFDDHTMVMAFDGRRSGECRDCRACVRACPVGIDIRKGASSACFNCAECLDACSDIMKKKNTKGLIGYFFGRPGDERRLLRPNVVVISIVTFFFLAFFIGLSVKRTDLDVTLVPLNTVAPRIASDGRSVNAYTLSVENRGREKMRLSLAASAGSRPVELKPSEAELPPGEYKKISLYAVMRPGAAGGASVPLEVTVSSSTGGETVKKTIMFHVPEAQ